MYLVPGEFPFSKRVAQQTSNARWQIFLGFKLHNEVKRSLNIHITMPGQEEMFEQAKIVESPLEKDWAETLNNFKYIISNNFKQLFW